MVLVLFFFFFSSRRRHTRWTGDWSSDVCSSDLFGLTGAQPGSCVGSANAFNAVPYPGALDGDFDAYLKAGPDLPYPGFAQCFANGLPASQAAVLAAAQRPI